MILVYSRLRERKQIDKSWQNIDKRKKFERRYHEKLSIDSGLHVCLIGVGQYSPSSGFPSLTTPATSVYSLYQTLHRQRRVLNISTIRILMSPSKEELKSTDLIHIKLKQFYDNRKNNPTIRTSFTNFKTEVRKLLLQKSSPTSQTLLYFAGHGFGAKTRQQIVFFSEYTTSDPLEECTNLDSIIEFGPFHSKIENHIFLFDCCRTNALEDPELVEMLQNNLPNLPFVFPKKYSLKQQTINYLRMYPTASYTINKAQKLKSTIFSSAIKKAFLGYSLTINPKTGRQNITSQSFAKTISNYCDWKIKLLEKQPRFKNAFKHQICSPTHEGKEFSFCEWKTHLPFFKFFIEVEPKLQVFTKLEITISHLVKKQPITVYLDLLNKNFHSVCFDTLCFNVKSELQFKKNLNMSGVKKRQKLIAENFHPADYCPPSFQVKVSHKVANNAIQTARGLQVLTILDDDEKIDELLDKVIEKFIDQKMDNSTLFDFAQSLII